MSYSIIYTNPEDQDKNVYAYSNYGNEHDSLTTISKVKVIDMIKESSNCSEDDANTLYIKLCEEHISVDTFLTFIIVNIKETIDITKFYQNLTKNSF